VKKKKIFLIEKLRINEENNQFSENRRYDERSGFKNVKFINCSSCSMRVA